MFSCDKCIYAVKIVDYEVSVEWRCHRYPPKNNYEYPRVYTFYDPSKRGDWCGEFTKVNEVEG